MTSIALQYMQLVRRTMEDATEDSTFPERVWRAGQGYASVVLETTPVPDHLWDSSVRLVLFDIAVVISAGDLS